MSALTPLKLTREKAAYSGLASQSDWTTPAKPVTASKTSFSGTSTVRTYGKNQQEPVLGYIPGRPKDSTVSTKQGGIKRTKRSKSKKNRRTRRR